MTGNILITGGVGFIGKRLVFYLLKRHPDTRIWVLDNLHPQVYGTEAEFPNFGANVTCIKGDVTDFQTMRRVVRDAQPLIVYHLAAETGTGQSYDEVTRYCQVNVVGTAQVIDALRQESPMTRRVVLAGSRAVYGRVAIRTKPGESLSVLDVRQTQWKKGIFRYPCRPIASHPLKQFLATRA